MPNSCADAFTDGKNPSTPVNASNGRYEPRSSDCSITDKVCDSPPVAEGRKEDSKEIIFFLSGPSRPQENSGFSPPSRPNARRTDIVPDLVGLEPHYSPECPTLPSKSRAAPIKPNSFITSRITFQGSGARTPEVHTVAQSLRARASAHPHCYTASRSGAVFIVDAHRRFFLTRER